jgi:hypothetical protein
MRQGHGVSFLRSSRYLETVLPAGRAGLRAPAGLSEFRPEGLDAPRGGVDCDSKPDFIRFLNIAKGSAMPQTEH